MFSAILRTISSAGVPFHDGWPLQPAAVPAPLPDRFAISGSRPDTVVRDIPPPRPPVMAPGFHGRPSPAILTPHRCQDYHGQSGHHPAYYQPQALSVTAALQGHELRIPAAFTRPSPLNPRSPFPSSVVSGSARYLLTCRYGQTPAVPHTARIFAPRCNKPCRTVSPGQPP